MGIHKDLAHMADEEFKQADVLFGEDVVERVKKRHDALKTLRSVKQPFQKGGAQKRNRFGRREILNILSNRPDFGGTVPIFGAKILDVPLFLLIK